MRGRALLTVAVVLVLASGVRGADAPPPLLAASGTVEKVGRDTLSIRPRDAAGRFGKSVILKLTGTSEITTLTVQMRGGKPIPTQKKTEAADLKPNQTIAVLYTTVKGAPILLTAVVVPFAGR
jgi:hypothetical protein